MAKKQKHTPRPRASLPMKLLILTMLGLIGWQLFHLNRQVETARAEQERYATQVAALQQANAALEASIAEGATPEKMEQIARDQLYLVTQDEYVFYETGN